MKKKIFGGIFVLTIVAITLFNVNLGMNSLNPKLSSLNLANLEALANESGESGGTGEAGRPPEWWDFFNNYEVHERIPVNTTTCEGGIVTYKGIILSIGSCTKYTLVIYHHCFDGGERDECTSSHVQDYL